MVSGKLTKRPSTGAVPEHKPGAETPEAEEPDVETLEQELQQVRTQLVEAALAGQELVERNHQLQEQLQEKVDVLAETQQQVEKERRRAAQLDRAVQEAKERQEKAAEEKAAAEAKVRLLDDAAAQQVTELLGMSQQLEELTREKRDRERQAEKSRLDQEAQEWRRRETVATEAVGGKRKSKTDIMSQRSEELVEENKLLRVKFAACRWMYVAGASLRQDMQEELSELKAAAQKAQHERDGKAQEVQDLEKAVKLERGKAEDMVQEQEQLLKERALLRKQTRELTADRDAMQKARSELEQELSVAEARAKAAESDAKSFVVALQDQQGQSKWQRAFRKVQRSGQRASTEPVQGNSPIVCSPTRKRRTVNFDSGEATNLLDELEGEMSAPASCDSSEEEDEVALSARRAADAAQQAAQRAEEQAQRLEAERLELAEHRRVVEEQVRQMAQMQQVQVEQQIAAAVQQRVKAELDSAVESEKAKWIQKQVADAAEAAAASPKHFAWGELESAEQGVRTFRVENVLKASTHGVRYRLSARLDDGDPDLKQYAPWDSILRGKVSKDGEWLAVNCGGVEKFVPMALQGERILKEVHSDTESPSPFVSPRPTRARTRLRRAGVNAATLRSLHQANARAPDAEELPPVVVPIPDRVADSPRERSSLLDQGRQLLEPKRRGRAPSQSPSRSVSPEVSPRPHGELTDRTDRSPRLSSRSKEAPQSWTRVKKSYVDTSALEAMGIPVDKYQQLRKSIRPQ